MIQTQNVTIAIVAGEPSGDNLGAGLIRALKNRLPDAKFQGIGGPRMQAEGCEMLFDMARIEAMGLEDALSKLYDILNIRRHLLRQFSNNPPDIFIGIDAPDFNLTLEEKLKKKGITTVHYVSPTVWAWRGYRIHKIKRAVSHMLALFPFEARFYAEKGIPVTCVGHPVADEIVKPDRLKARQELALRCDVALSAGEIVIALLPGSRRSEVKALGADLIESARLLHKKYAQKRQKIRFLLPLANDGVKTALLKVIGSLGNLPLTMLDGQSRLVIEAADVVVLASGTAALEATLLERPHIVIYRLAALTCWLFKHLKHVDHYSMSNQLLRFPEVPELMQQQVTPENIAGCVEEYLDNPQRCRALEGKFKAIRTQLKLDANTQAALVISRLIAHAPPI